MHDRRRPLQHGHPARHRDLRHDRAVSKDADRLALEVRQAANRVTRPGPRRRRHPSQGHGQQDVRPRRGDRRGGRAEDRQAVLIPVRVGQDDGVAHVRGRRELEDAAARRDREHVGRTPGRSPSHRDRGRRRVCAVVGQATVHEEAVLEVIDLPASEPLHVPLRHPADGPLDDDVQTVLGTLGHRSARLEIAVRFVLVPCADLLLGDVRQSEHASRARDEPQERLRSLAVAHVRDVEIVEQVRGSDRQVTSHEPARLPRVSEFAHVAVAGRAVHHRVIHDGRLHVVRTDIGLRSHRDRGRRDHVAVHRADAPLGGAREREELRQRDEVADRVCFPCCDAKRDAVGIKKRDVVGDVALGASARHP